MRKRNFEICILVFCSIITGCSALRIGDNAVLVSGKTSEECLLMLLPSNGDRSHHFYYRKVNGAFFEDFTISPNRGIYKLELTCSGKLVYERSILYPDQVELFEIGVVS